MNNVSCKGMVGRVKWFDIKKGYGFATVVEGDYVGQDVFIHYKDIDNNESSYKYLIQGEYIKFVLETITNGKTITKQGVCINALNGGKLLCETPNKKNKNKKEDANVVIIEQDAFTNQITIKPTTRIHVRIPSHKRVKI